MNKDKIETLIARTAGTVAVLALLGFIALLYIGANTDWFR